MCIKTFLKSRELAGKKVNISLFIAREIWFKYLPLDVHLIKVDAWQQDPSERAG
jgi:hypothetical protein